LSKAEKGGATVINLSANELAQWKAIAPKAQESILNDLGVKGRARWSQIEIAKKACAG